MLLDNLPQRIEAASLAMYIPHSGPMVLLDTIEEWDDEHIVCTTRSHKKANHPLKIDGILSSVHTIEYGAQAVSFHAALMSISHNRPVLGIEKHGGISLAFLAVVRDFDFNDVNVATIDDILTIEADKPYVFPRLLQYRVRAKSGGTIIAQGEISLVVER